MLEEKELISEKKSIDIFEISKKLWKSKKFILKVSSIGLLVGSIIAFSFPTEYTTAVILTPNSQSSTSGGMGALAALAGVNINSNNIEAFASPDLYPEVLNSTPFLKGLLKINVKDRDMNIDTTLYKYMEAYQKIAWWNYILKASSKLIGLLKPSKIESENLENNKFIISEEEMSIISNLRDRFEINWDKKTGITTINVTMQDSRISAYMADTLTSYLQSYIIDYRTQKAREDLLYAEKLYEESKTEYYEAQKKLAFYIDENVNVVLARYRITQERLQNEATLKFSIYNQMAQQLQMARIKVQDTTPVFAIIQPAIEPLKPSKPPKKIIIVGFIFLAILCASVWIIRYDILAELKNKDE